MDERRMLGYAILLVAAGLVLSAFLSSGLDVLGVLLLILVAAPAEKWLRRPNGRVAKPITWTPAWPMLGLLVVALAISDGLGRIPGQNLLAEPGAQTGLSLGLWSLLPVGAERRRAA